jgi:hypothetical protein
LLRHATIPDLSIRDLHNVAENYIDVAKVISGLSLLFLAHSFHLLRQNLLSAVAHIPSLETLHGLMLLCWFEHSHHRLPGKRDRTTYIRRMN